MRLFWAVAGVCVGAGAAVGLGAWITRRRLETAGRQLEAGLAGGGDALTLALALRGEQLEAELGPLGRETVEAVAARHLRDVYGFTPALAGQIRAARQAWRL